MNKIIESSSIGQKLKKRIEELELQLEYANFNSRPIVQKMSLHPIPMTAVSYSNPTEDNILPHIGHIEDIFTKPSGQLESLWNPQEYNLLFGVSPPFGHIRTPLSGTELSPLPMRNLTDES
jgi:hypothetical protein